MCFQEIWNIKLLICTAYRATVPSPETPAKKDVKMRALQPRGVGWGRRGIQEGGGMYVPMGHSC